MKRRAVAGVVVANVLGLWAGAGSLLAGDATDVKGGVPQDVRAVASGGLMGPPVHMLNA